MKAHAPGSNSLTQHWDKVALLIALSLVLASSVILVIRANAVKSEAKMGGMTYTGEKKPAVVTDLAPFDKALVALNAPFQASNANERLAVGELRVSCVVCGRPIPYKALTCPFDASHQQPPLLEAEQDSDGDGIPDAVEKKWGLNPADPNDARGDLDKDGYSNLEEYKAGTDPRDPTKHPTAVAKLRLLRAVVEPFRFRFLGVTKGPSGDRYQLNVRTLDRTYFVKLDEVVEGFKVAGVETNAGIPALILSQGDRQIRLVQGRVINEDSLNALLIFLLDGQQYRVGINSTIKLQGKSYKVVDINRDRVVVRDEEAGADSPVYPLSDEERQQLRGGVAPPQ